MIAEFRRSRLVATTRGHCISLELPTTISGDEQASDHAVKIIYTFLSIAMCRRHRAAYYLALFASERLTRHQNVTVLRTIITFKGMQLNLGSTTSTGGTLVR